MVGLLDGLQFDPSTYGGQQGGLLAMIQSALAQQQNAPAAPTSPQSVPDPSVFNTGAAPDPVAGIASSAGAIPQGLPSAVAPPATFADRFNAASPAPTFGAGAAPIFAAPPGVPGNPAMPAAPIVAQGDDDEEDTPAKPAANASPIAVGGYQMPRVGPASAFAPDPAALPTNAQPTQGTAPALPAAPFAAAGDHLKAAWQSMRHGGGLIGGLSGLVTGQRDDPQNDALQAQQTQQQQQFKALTDAGVPANLAYAAVINPKAAETIIPQALGQGSHAQETDKDGNIWDVNKQTGQRTLSLQPKDDKFQHFVVKRPDGSESIKSFNTKTGEVTDVPNSGPGADRPAVDPDSTGPERMKQLQAADPNYARRVQAAVDGDIQLPTQGQAARSPAAARFTEDVLAVSGSTSASDFATKAATRKDYASGIASRVTKSINTTIGHFATLDDTIDRLGNHTYFPSVTNYLHDKVASNTDPEYQKAKATFETNKEAAIKELDFALSGGHSSVSGSAEIRDKFNRADSPETLHAAVTEAMSLLQKRLQSHAKAFSEGTKSQRDEQDFIYPENRASFNKLLGSKDTSTGNGVPGVSAAPAAPTAPQAALKPGVYDWSKDRGAVPTQ